MQNKLVKLLEESDATLTHTRKEHHNGYRANYLISHGVVVPPDELFAIIDRGRPGAWVSNVVVDILPLYVIKEPEKHGYFRTKEAAEQVIELEAKKW